MTTQPETTGDQAAAIAAARRAIERKHSEVRAYVPPLLGRMGLTYGLTGLAVIVVTVVGAAIILPIAGGFTGATSVFLLNLLVLIYGWRWAERRFSGTSLFIVYTVYSRARRDLQALLAAIESGSGDASAIDAHLQRCKETADNFITAMRDHGAQPHRA